MFYTVVRGAGLRGMLGRMLPLSGNRSLTNQTVPYWYYFMTSTLSRLTLKVFYRSPWRQYMLTLNGNGFSDLFFRNVPAAQIFLVK